MEIWDEPNLADVPFADLTEISADILDESLLTLSGDRSMAAPPFETPLIQRVAEAWMTPLRRLTCAQVVMLTVQKLGLEWLAEPVIAFATVRPTGECRFYPGDLTLAALQAHDELLHYALLEAREWLAGPFDWFDETYRFDPNLVAMAHSSLDQARGARRLA